MFIVSLIIGIVCYIIYQKTSYWYIDKRNIKQDIINDTANIVGWITGITCGLSLLVGGTLYAIGYQAEKALVIYQEENEKIEKNIEIVVKNYMNYEKETYIEFQSESSITYVSLYPNLKSDELVKKQIETYVSNNAKIKELKESIINLKIGKWLLYFG